MPALGERFRAAREARGLTLSEVAEQIRIRSVYLAAIEEEHWSSIGAPVYVRGFLRTYARFLGLDAEEAVAEFNATGAPPPEPEPDLSRPIGVERYGRRSLSPLIWIASAVAVALIAYVVFNAMTYRQSGTSAVAVSAASPTPAATASAEVPATAVPSAAPTSGALVPQPNTLAIQLSAPSWLRVVVDGTVSMEGTFPAGTSKTFHGKIAHVRVGNAGGVQIEVDGRSIGALGKSGDVVDRTFVL